MDIKNFMPTQELLNYIKKQIESGTETEKIKDSLRFVGWRDIDIIEINDY